MRAELKFRASLLKSSGIFFSLVLFSILTMSVRSAPLLGEWIEYTQPDGTKLQLQVYGDEYYAETRTAEGFTVYFDSATKCYYYALLASNGTQLISSGIPVGSNAPPANVNKKITITSARKRSISEENRSKDPSVGHQKERWEKIKQNNRNKRSKTSKTEITENVSAKDLDEEALMATAIPRVYETTGIRVGLTILVQFPDETGTISRREVDEYCNLPGYSGFSNDGSIFDFFYEQSDGKLKYYNVVTPYVTVPHPKSYYNDTSLGSGTCGRLLLNDALQVLLDSGFDFTNCTVDGSGQLHAVNVFFTGANSGVWAKGLWPHKSSLSPSVDLGNGQRAYQYQITNMGSSLRLGTFCHENGHLICGYPDFYDYDYDSKGNGYYTLMAYSGYSTHPTSVGAYLRYHSGWADAVIISSNSHFRGSVRTGHSPVYLFENPDNENEYFMLENRAKFGWEADGYLPDQGFMIMHCDENGNGSRNEMTTAEHFEVSIEQADGLFQLEYNINSGGSGDLFHQGYVDSFTDLTLPNAHWWQNTTTNPVSGDASGLHLHSIGPVGEVQTFIVGEGTLSGSPDLEVDRSLIQSEAFMGNALPGKKVAVWNAGAGVLSYSVSSTVSWVQTSLSSGTISNESDLVSLTFSTNGLSTGTNVGLVVFSNDADPADLHTLTVEAYVQSGPSMQVSISNFSATVVGGNTSDPEYFLVSNVGESEMAYGLSDMPSWVVLPETNGTVTGESDPVQLYFDGTGLTVGTYSSSLTVASAGTSGSPVTIGLSLEVLELALQPLASTFFTNQQNVTISWLYTAGSITHVDIELLKDGVSVETIAAGTPNDGSHSWLIPADLISGDRFYIRLSGVDSTTTVVSEEFAIALYAESFENDAGGWAGLPSDDLPWSRNSGGTPSSYTGPSAAPEGLFYMYTEASSPNYPSKIATLNRSFDLSRFAEVELSFDYHMYGSDMGSLIVDFFDGSLWISNVWMSSGQQHGANTSAWSRASVDLSAWGGRSDVGIRFRGITGDGFTSDMAIDSLRLLNTGTPFHYVNINSTDPVAPFISWETAATNIQDAVNAASSNDTVLVTNGTYLLSSEIMVTNDILLKSVNGRDVTIVDGQDAVRCLNLGSNACVVSGFTIRNGTKFKGGGIYCTDMSPVITNCTVTANHARFGAGIYGGTAYDCIISNNGGAGRILDCYEGAGIFRGTAVRCVISQNSANGSGGSGGGLYDSYAVNCLIANNYARDGGGGGMIGGVASNCTIVDNSAWETSGAGMQNGSLYNCIVVGNFAVFGEVDDAHDIVSSFVQNSCSPDAPDGVNGNMVKLPLFVNEIGGNYRLMSNSPCINWAATAYTNGLIDLDGSNRVVESYVDMGCYEYQGILGLSDSDNDGLPDEWERQFFGGNADPDRDDDGDGQNNRDEQIAGTVPTNEASYFSITHFGPSGIEWWPCSTGRYYSVWWSTNLLAGFQSLGVDLEYPQNSYTFTVYSNWPQAFYRIRVGLEPEQVEVPEGMVLIPVGTNAVNDGIYSNYSLVVDQTFYMDKFEVSGALWSEVYDWAVTNDYDFSSNGIWALPDHPVVWINWYDCAKWCNARSTMKGRDPCYFVSTNIFKRGEVMGVETDYSADGFRMPTQNEWEYAARGGYGNYLYPWGNTYAISDANYALNETTACGSYTTNYFGLYDIVGNVWEWCDNITVTNSLGVAERRGRASGGFGNVSASYLKCGIHAAAPADGETDNSWKSLGFRTICR